ncbi:hypothetical protein NON00_13655 [Roseomonas sp. GC11]|uniref:hypothetical protein n=1 Tax=Roseomonas sp. GC11 TaxID=2950546 RepID=UPI00210A03D7|nr:hypothetical protein [Roseomonas sp. GC11]MCQ4160971.1 hypothetical protein [Roseomonas sp. GC11]
MSTVSNLLNQTPIQGRKAFWRLRMCFLLFLPLVTAGGAAPSPARPYLVAGPANLVEDAPLCRRLATALNAEPADRDLAAPRADPLFARWQPNDPGNWRARLTFDPLIQVVRADILGEGQPRRVYRVNNPFVPYDPVQILVFMRDDAEPLPQESRAGPSVWAEAFASGRMIDASNVLFGPEDQTIQHFIARNPPAATAAGRRFGRAFRRTDAEDLVLLDSGRVLYLSVSTKDRVAMLAELRAPHPRVVCYLASLR